MPERKTIERAHKDKREGKAPSTQAGEFVREEMHHVREGKHGARSTKQAIAIGLSKARRAGVKLSAPKKGTASARTRRQASRDIAKGKSGTKRRPAQTRSRAVRGALKREGHAAASRRSLAKQAHASARRRSASQRSAAARKAAHTKGARGRAAAARKAARTRARHRWTISAIASSGASSPVSRVWSSVPWIRGQTRDAAPPSPAAARGAGQRPGWRPPD